LKQGRPGQRLTVVRSVEKQAHRSLRSREIFPERWPRPNSEFQ
jgi:hypothetical protein